MTSRTVCDAGRFTSVNMGMPAPPVAAARETTLMRSSVTRPASPGERSVCTVMCELPARSTHSITGAALVILGGLPAEPPLPARLLAVGPLRFLGRISYSVYLWHWPILILGAAILGPTMTIPLALLSIPVAAATQRWIEEPFRHGRIIGIRPGRNLLQAAGVGLAVVLIAWRRYVFVGIVAAAAVVAIGRATFGA